MSYSKDFSDFWIAKYYSGHKQTEMQPAQYSVLQKKTIYIHCMLPNYNPIRIELLATVVVEWETFLLSKR